jgi:argininosuccinate synthase
MAKKICIAYSGGLDTSAAIPWLKENYPGAEVIAVVGDVGQGSDELAGVEQKAKNSGASACYVVDLKKEFIEDYVFPTMLTGAMYEGRYLLGTAIARPILAKAQVEVALKTGCDALSHGCTGKGNDQVRFESCYSALAPNLELISVWRKWNLRSREDLLAYLAKHNVPTTASATKIYSRDRNLWHISHEGGAIENPWNAPPEDVWMLTADPRQAPDKHEDVSIAFKKGRPVAVNGVALAGDALVAKLNDIGGRHGVGRVDLVENRLVGMKSRGLYETPGGTIIVEALKGVQELVLDRETRHFHEHIGLTFAELVYNGRWFTPLREALSAFAESVAGKLDGEVVVRLYKGTATAVQRKSPNSLYSETFATFGKEEVYNQQHSEGFIRLFSLPERIRALKAMHKVD